MKNKIGILAGIVLVATVVGLLLQSAGNFGPHTGVKANSVLSQQLQASNGQAPIDTASMPTVSPMNSDIAGRDAKRISDLQQVQNDLQLYYNKCGYYPVVPANPNCLAVPVGGAVRWSALTAALTSTPSLGITNVPNDPITGANYIYGVTAGGTGYVLGAMLEDAKNPSLVQSMKGAADGVNCAGSVYCVKL